MERVLFLCGRNKARSPTAEQIFGGWPGLEVMSAGLSPDAEVVCDAEMVAWAGLIFVMEKRQRAKLATKFRKELTRARIICLDIPDKFEFMEPALVQLLEARAGKHLRG